MADSASEEVGSLLRRLANHLGKKLTSFLMFLFNNKNAGSFGAVAGFALAIVFAWRFLRTPGRPPRRKRRNGPSTSNAGLGNAQASNSGTNQPLLTANDFDLVEEISHPAERTLGQIVRKKLNGGRKVTCKLLGVVLEERSSDELKRHATIRSSVIEALTELTKSCDLYVMETVEDDESEERVLAALDEAGVFKTGALVKEKVLFCSTENGRSSFVRQLEPDWHIDTNSEIVSNLSRFIRYQLHISPGPSGFLANNVYTSASLEQYFTSV